MLFVAHESLCALAKSPEALKPKEKNLTGFLNIDGLLISLVEFTDLPVFLLNSEHKYWQNFENAEKLGRFMHTCTLYMELIGKYWESM